MSEDTPGARCTRISTFSEVRSSTFQTGGSIDVSRYNDGERGGMVKVRAKINKIDNKTLSIAEVPFGKTVPGVCDSIVKASEKGKIKIRKVEDLTSEKV